MAKTFQLKILTPNQVILDEAVSFVSVESTEGSLGVLADHTPLVAILRIAPLHYMKGDETHYAAVMGGFLKVVANQAIILTDAAEMAKEIDHLRAEEAKREAEALLTTKQQQTDLLRAEIALQKALARLKAVEKVRRQRRNVT